MSYMVHKDLSYSTIPTGGAPSPSTTGASLKVASAADRALFPTPPFMATVWPSGTSPAAANAEIVQINGTTGTDGFVMARAQEGSTAQAIVAGYQIAATVTTRPFTDLETSVNQLTYNVKYYGAAGDGTTNDRGPILTAINAAGAAGGGVVYFPPGTYLINSTINCVYGNIVLRGAGTGLTTFLLGYAQTNGGNGMFYCNNTDGVTPTSNLRFEDFSINMNGFANNGIQVEAPTIGTGITSNILFRDLEIYNRGPDASGNSGAIKLRGVYNSTNGSLSNVTFDHIYIHDAAPTTNILQTGYSIFVESNNIQHCYFKDCYFYNTYGKTVVFTDQGTLAVARQRKDIVFQNCSFVKTQSLAFGSAISDISDSNANGFNGIRILGCLFQPDPTFVASSTNSYCLQIYNSLNFIVDDCVFDGPVSVIASGGQIFGNDKMSTTWTFSNNTVRNTLVFSDPDGHYGGTYTNNVFYRLTRAFGVGYARHYPTKVQNNLFLNCLITPEDTVHEYTQAIMNISDAGNIIENNTFFNEQAQSTPTAPTVAVNTAKGNLNGIYTYKITFVVKDLGETNGGATSASVSPIGQKVNLSNIPLGGTGVTSRRIYRTIANGPDGTQKLIAELDIQAKQTTTTYTDNIADNTTGLTAEFASLGTLVPITNTTLSNVKYIFAELSAGGSIYNPNIYKNNTIFGQGASFKTFYLDSNFGHVITGNTGVTENTIQNSATAGALVTSSLPSTDTVYGNFQANGQPILNESLVSGLSMRSSRNPRATASGLVELMYNTVDTNLYFYDESGNPHLFTMSAGTTTSTSSTSSSTSSTSTSSTSSSISTSSTSQSTSTSFSSTSTSSTSSSTSISSTSSSLSTSSTSSSISTSSTSTSTTVIAFQ